MLSEITKNTNFRYSRQRERILKILKESGKPMTATEVFKQTKKHITKISLGTVYRNLNQLANNKFIKEIYCEKEEVYYEYGSEQSSHFKCTQCNILTKINMPIASVITRGVEKNEGHIVRDLHLIIWGICKECKEKANNLK